MMPRLLRGLAILIAIAGVVDPAVTSMRTARPEISVVAADTAGQRELMVRVTRALDERFTVIPASFAAAAATVVVGDRLPETTGGLATPAFVVLPERDGPSVTIEDLRAPSSVAIDAQVPVSATVRTVGASGRTLHVSVNVGDIVVDRASLDIGTDDARRIVPLSFTPTAAGAVALRVTAAIADRGAAAPAAGTSTQRSRGEEQSADLVVDVRDERWSVLFFDPRPSWLSTFVRRSVEADPRFVVTSRIITSRGVSTDAGQPPSRLDDHTELALFDAVVVGAPESLTDRDVSGLEAYLRRRGGAVILLLDERTSGAYDRLTDVGRWSTTSSSAGYAILPVGADSGDSVGLRVTALAVPAALPRGAEAIATSPVPAGGAAAARPVVWRMAVGVGELVVSGALDAWRFREPSQSGFDRFWRSVIADAAAGSPPPIEVMVGATALAPGERASVGVRLRDPSLLDLAAAGPARASVAAAIETPEGPIPVQLWPEGPPGHLAGEFRTPATPGAYRITVTSDGYRAEAPFVVSAAPLTASRDNAGITGAWARSRGGDVIASTSLGDLVPMLERTVNPVTRRETWYPMRSAWWIVPLAVLLGAEWLWRRRRGLA